VCLSFCSLPVDTHECVSASFYARLDKRAFENTDYAVGSNRHLIHLCAIDKESVLYRLCGGDLADKLDVREGGRKGGREGGREGGRG
jgi:hypothetical protein